MEVGIPGLCPPFAAVISVPLLCAVLQREGEGCWCLHGSGGDIVPLADVLACPHLSPTRPNCCLSAAARGGGQVDSSTSACLPLSPLSVSFLPEGTEQSWGLGQSFPGRQPSYSCFSQGHWEGAVCGPMSSTGRTQAVLKACFYLRGSPWSCDGGWLLPGTVTSGPGLGRDWLCTPGNRLTPTWSLAKGARSWPVLAQHCEGAGSCTAPLACMQGCTAGCLLFPAGAGGCALEKGGQA